MTRRRRRLRFKRRSGQRFRVGGVVVQINQRRGKGREFVVRITAPAGVEVERL